MGKKRNRRMSIFSTIAIGLLLSLGSSCTASQSRLDVEDLENRGVVGKAFYLRHSIYYYHRKYITTNYHVKQPLPINTKVIVMDLSPRKIKLKLAGKRRSLTILNHIMYTHQSIGTIFDRMLSPEPVSLAGLTEMEQRNVKAATIELGMSKRAVVMAYGYPPHFVTESLDEDEWTYWISRFSKIRVHFSDGLVSTISED